METTDTNQAAIEAGELEVVTFLWSTKNGECLDCGHPAAFKNSTGQALCSVCAANHAADGDTISRIITYVVTETCTYNIDAASPEEAEAAFLEMTSTQHDKIRTGVIDRTVEGEY